jgi:uncharacterized protein YcbK (DUF882 family)
MRKQLKALAGVALLSGVSLGAGIAQAPASEPPEAEQYHLRMHHLHTGESLDVVYKVGDRYVPSALAMLNHFLRDHRTGDVSSYDPREFDVLHELMVKLGRPGGEIDIVCGYRTPWWPRRLTSACPGSRPSGCATRRCRCTRAGSATIRRASLSTSMSGLCGSGVCNSKGGPSLDLRPGRRTSPADSGEIT